MKNVSIFSKFSVEDNGLKNKKIHSTFAVFSVASISSRTWIASNCVLELDAANPMKTRIVAAISDNDVTAFTSESNVTLASVVFYEIYACSWNLRKIYIKHILKQWIVYFARSDWLLNQWISSAIYWFTSSSSKRATPNSHKTTSKMASRFAAVTNKEISQIIKQAVPEIHEEGDEVRFGSFNR